MTKKPIIAVDIDDVLVDSAENFVRYSNEKWGTSLHVDDYSEHWAQMWKVDAAEGAKRAHHIYTSKLQFGFSPFEEALPVLRRLSYSFDLVIVTSRHRLVQPDTLEWLRIHYEGIFSQVQFAGIWDKGHTAEHAINLTKGAIVEGLGADYLIDDQPKHCIAAAKKGVTSLLFGDYEWTRNVSLKPNMVRVKDWPAVEAYFYARD